jgi:WD40 repeat protein
VTLAETDVATSDEHEGQGPVSSTKPEPGPASVPSITATPPSDEIPTEPEDWLQVHIMAGHQDAVTAVAFSPDGRFLASGDNRGKIFLWDAATGAFVRILQGHTRTINTITFSPDSVLVASGSWDNTIRIWDTATGELMRALQGRKESVTDLAFSPDGKLLASGSLDTAVDLWDPATGVIEGTLTGHTDAVLSVAFSPDGQMLASGSKDKTIRLWSVPSRSFIRSLTGHTAAVRAVAFSPDGSLLVSGAGGEDYAARLWVPSTGAFVRSLEGQADGLSDVAFSPTGQVVAAAGGYGDKRAARFWNVNTGVVVMTIRGDSDYENAIAFSPDGETLAWSNALAVELWESRTGLLIQTLRGSKGDVSAIAFSADGSYIAAGDSYPTMMLWDARTGALARTFEGESCVTSVAYSPDGQTIASASYDGTVRVSDALGRVSRRPLATDLGEINAVVFSPDGHLVAVGVGYPSDTITVLDAATGTVVRTLNGHSGYVYSVAFSPDGATIASGSGGSDYTVRIWATATGTLLRTLEGHGDDIHSVAFSPDGTLLASGSNDKTVRVWETATGALRVTLTGHQKPVTAVAFSPNGRFVAASSGDATIRFWDAERGRAVGRLTFPALYDEYVPYRRGVLSIAFSPDGKYLAAGLDYGVLRLLKVHSQITAPASTGAGTSVRYFAPLDATLCLELNPDGTFLVGPLNGDGTAVEGSSRGRWQLGDSGTVALTFPAPLGRVEGVATPSGLVFPDVNQLSYLGLGNVSVVWVREGAPLGPGLETGWRRVNGERGESLFLNSDGTYSLTIWKPHTLMFESYEASYTWDGRVGRLKTPWYSADVITWDYVYLDGRLYHWDIDGVEIWESVSSGTSNSSASTPPLTSTPATTPTTPATTARPATTTPATTPAPVTPAPVTPVTTPLPSGCSHTLPQPELAFGGTESYEPAGGHYTRYRLMVVNWDSFPDELFAAAPGLPPCGLNANASRAWVHIYEGDGSPLYGFCGLQRAEHMTGIWFGLPEGKEPPDNVYIEIVDRLCGVTYRSNLAPIGQATQPSATRQSPVVPVSPTTTTPTTPNTTPTSPMPSTPALPGEAPASGSDPCGALAAQTSLTFEWRYQLLPKTLSAGIPNEVLCQSEHADVQRASAVFPYTGLEGLVAWKGDDALLVQLARRINAGYTDYYEVATNTLHFVQGLMPYTLDTDDYWQLPVETLVRQKGDCEDGAVLYVALMQGLGYSDSVRLGMYPGHVFAMIEVTSAWKTEVETLAPNKCLDLSDRWTVAQSPDGRLWALGETNVDPAWRTLGYTGLGCSCSIPKGFWQDGRVVMLAPGSGQPMRLVNVSSTDKLSRLRRLFFPNGAPAAAE